MHSAAACNHFEIVKLLIEKGAHIDAIDDVSGTMISTGPFCHLSVLYFRVFVYPDSYALSLV